MRIHVRFLIRNGLMLQKYTKSAKIYTYSVKYCKEINFSSCFL